MMNDDPTPTQASRSGESGRPLAIRNAMLRRADRRRRTRQCSAGAATLACLLMVAASTWLIAKPRHTAPDVLTRQASTDEARPIDPQSEHSLIEASVPVVVERAISDDELIALLAEAGEPAGLATVNGTTELVRWDTATHEEPTEPLPTGPTGLHPSPTNQSTHPVMTTNRVSRADQISATG